MTKPAYVPPSEFMFNVVLDALNFANALAKSKQDEVKELKDKNQLLGDTINIQAELDRRTRVERQNLKKGLDSRTLQVEQLRKEVAELTADNDRLLREIRNPRYHYDCPF
jgi:hypothetical protein